MPIPWLPPRETSGRGKLPQATAGVGTQNQLGVPRDPTTWRDRDHLPIATAPYRGSGPSRGSNAQGKARAGLD